MKQAETIKKIRAMDLAALNKELDQVEKDLNILMLSVKAGKKTNTADIPKQRKYLAQIKTIMREKETGNE